MQLAPAAAWAWVRLLDRPMRLRRRSGHLELVEGQSFAVGLEVTADGGPMPGRAVVVDRVGEQHIGLRRAEYEGQLSRVVEQPEVLEELAGVLAQRHPDRPAWVELSVVQTAYELVDGVPQGETAEVLATWRASP